MEPKSEKGYILRWIIGCLATILLFHFAWAQYLFMNWSNNLLFTLVDAVLFAGFIGTALGAYTQADDPNYEYLRKIFIALTVASSIWAAAWSTGLMNNIQQGIN